MNSGIPKREQKVFFAQGGEKITVEVDPGGVWFNPRKPDGKSPLQDNAHELLKECLAIHENRRSRFRITLPVTLVLFLASFLLHIGASGFSFLAAILSLGFIFFAAATVYYHVTSGGSGELATVSHRAEGVPESSGYPAAAFPGYRDYISNAPGYSMPVLSPRLYSILTEGSPLRSKIHRRPLTVTARGVTVA